MKSNGLPPRLDVSSLSVSRWSTSSSSVTTNDASSIVPSGSPTTLTSPVSTGPVPPETGTAVAPVFTMSVSSSTVTCEPPSNSMTVPASSVNESMPGSSICSRISTSFSSSKSPPTLTFTGARLLVMSSWMKPSSPVALKPSESTTEEATSNAEASVSIKNPSVALIPNPSDMA